MTSKVTSAERAGPAELAIIVPTLNEVDNVRELVRRLVDQLRGISWEVIFVDDDSTDGTTEQLRKLSREDPRVRSILRIGRRGLSTACIEGILSSSAPYIAVMDADLQHDETLLPTMLEAIQKDHTDVVIASRYMAGGGTSDWDLSRVHASRLATRFSRWLFKCDLTDPMSGFFILRRNTFEHAMRRLSGIGFKILLDLFASSETPLRFKEIPFTFRSRQHGESKLDTLVMWDFLMMIGDQLFGRFLPVRFLSFGIIGGLGVFVHMTVLLTLFKGFKLSFGTSQTVAALTAVLMNYSLNNILTYHDRRRRGWKWITGLLSFYIVCSVGAFTNIAVAMYLYHSHIWWIFAALAGIFIGSVWNFALSAVYTWKK